MPTSLPPLSLVALAALSLGGAPARACEGEITWAGEAALVDAVRNAMAQPHRPCDALTVRVDRPALADADPRALWVHITDAEGRSTSRTVPDAAVAAALVRSWSRSDVTAALMPVPAPAPVVEREHTLASTPSRTPWAFRGVLSTSMASDQSTWMDLALGACAEVGPLCLGGYVRYAFDTKTTGDSSALPTDRLAADLMATADVPIRWPSVALHPGVGLGVGWTRSMGAVRGPLAETEERDRAAARLDAHCDVAVPLSEGVALSFAIVADYALTAHTRPFVEEGVPLAGEPRWHLRGGLGVRFEEGR